MTNKSNKKIIVIDDVSDRLQKLEEDNNFDFIEFTSDSSIYFEINKEGTELTIKFNSEDFEYIFIHHSLDNPNQSSNTINLLRNKLKEIKIVTFSGESLTILSELKLARSVFYSELYSFCEFGIKYNLFLPVFTGSDYKKKYMKLLFEKINFEEQFYLNPDYKQLCNLLQIPENSHIRINDNSKYKRLIKDKIEDQ